MPVVAFEFAIDSSGNFSPSSPQTLSPGTVVSVNSKMKGNVYISYVNDNSIPQPDRTLFENDLSSITVEQAPDQHLGTISGTAHKLHAGHYRLSTRPPTAQTDFEVVNGTINVDSSGDPPADED